MFRFILWNVEDISDKLLLFVFSDGSEDIGPLKELRQKV